MRKAKEGKKTDSDGQEPSAFCVRSFSLFVQKSTPIHMNMDAKKITKCVSNKHTCQSNYMLSHWNSEKFNLTDSNGLWLRPERTQCHYSQVVFRWLVSIAIEILCKKKTTKTINRKMAKLSIYSQHNNTDSFNLDFCQFFFSLLIFSSRLSAREHIIYPQ